MSVPSLCCSSITFSLKLGDKLDLLRQIQSLFLSCSRLGGLPKKNVVTFKLKSLWKTHLKIDGTILSIGEIQTIYSFWRVGGGEGEKALN